MPTIRNMLRKIAIAAVAVAAIAAIAAPGEALARGKGGRSHGGGYHGAGYHGVGSRAGLFRGGYYSGYHGWSRGEFAPGIPFSPAIYPYTIYPHLYWSYAAAHDCRRVVRVHTRKGQRLRRAWVCG